MTTGAAAALVAGHRRYRHTPRHGAGGRSATANPLPACRERGTGGAWHCTPKADDSAALAPVHHRLESSISTLAWPSGIPRRVWAGLARTVPAAVPAGNGRASALLQVQHSLPHSRWQALAKRPGACSSAHRQKRPRHGARVPAGNKKPPAPCGDWRFAAAARSPCRQLQTQCAKPRAGCNLLCRQGVPPLHDKRLAASMADRPHGASALLPGSAVPPQTETLTLTPTVSEEEVWEVVGVVVAACWLPPWPWWWWP